MTRVAVAVDRQTAPATDDDLVLLDALESAGYEVRPVVWTDDTPAEDEIVVVRSIWDYVEDHLRFVAWIDWLAGRRSPTINDPSAMRWSSDKRYLLDLLAADVPTVPTQVLGLAGAARIEGIEFAPDLGESLVVKPTVAGSARGAVRGHCGDPQLIAHAKRLAGAGGAVVQPYEPSVVSVGEISVIVIDGEPIAAVAKRPARGDWRVQSDFGGSVEPVALQPEAAEVAAAAVAAAPGSPLYARVDLLRCASSLLTLELELVEPELFFREVPGLAERFVAALTARVRAG